MSEPSNPRLPSGWKIRWLGKGERAEPPAVALDFTAVAERGDAVSTVFFRSGIAPFGRPSFPLGDVEIALSSFPSLDDVWALSMWARKERGQEIPKSFEAMCLYVADVRQGLWPDRVAPERSVQAIYLTMAQEILLGARPDRDRFLDEALHLCEHVGERLAAGARILDDDLFATSPSFERYSSLLVADRDLYREDRSRSRRYWAEIPAAHSPTKTARRLPLMVLDQPVARQFKLWARRDPDAPGGSGYPLLVTKLDKDAVIVSADPSQRATVGFLATALTAREKAARGGAEGAAWYDGRNHGGTLAAAPLDGTRLTLDSVIDVLKAELKLTPIQSAGSGAKPKRAIWAIAAVVVALAGAAGVVAMRGGEKARSAPIAAADGPEAPLRAPSSPPRAEGAESESPHGAKGEPLPKDEVISLIDKEDGPKAMKHYALIAGVCGYEGEHKLNSPCRDAREMRDLLVNDYGYKREDIVFLVDKPEGSDRVDGPPTAESMKSQIERFRSKRSATEDSTFLFYYSGHGGYVKGAQADFGVLQPSGFFTTYKDQPYQHRGWDMQRLMDDIKKGVPSKHIMLILDACYAGWAGAKGDDDFDARVRSLWKERAEVVLSAGSKGQRAWEDEPEKGAWVWEGHSAMTAFVLEGLRRDREGMANADKNRDKIVTDEELVAFVREKVPASVKSFKKANQTPAMFRLDQGYVKSGQFLFVPVGPSKPL